MSVAAKRILIVDDENDVIDLLKRAITKSGGFDVSIAHDGASGLEKARSELPSLVILDLMLPKMPGLEVCKILKTDKATSHIPILMLTARAEEIDRIVGLEIGADDYVTKPFSPREVMLRIQAILRRGTAGVPAGSNLVAGQIVIEPDTHRARVGAKTLDLTAIEFKLLSTLIQRRGRLQSRDRLLNDVWGYESIIDTRTVDTHVRRLREKLGKTGDWIETVRGFGYRFRGE